MSKVVNLKKVNGIRPEFDIYIGRKFDNGIDFFPESIWANPFSIYRYGREKSVKLYEEYVRNTLKLYNSLINLYNNILGCWCKPEICHGDVLVKLLKELLDRDYDCNKICDFCKKPMLKKTKKVLNPFMVDVYGIKRKIYLHNSCFNDVKHQI